MMKYVEKNSTGSHSVGYTYDGINNLTKLVETINNVKRETSYTYDDDNRPTSVNIGGSYRSYTYDTSGRVSEDVTRHHGSKLFTRSYTYRDASSGGTSTQPYRLVYTGDNFSTAFGYGYNNAGNISYTNVDGSINTYKYDSANQLIRENNRESGLTTLWTYDNAGNILKREVYPVTSGIPDPANKIFEVVYTYGDSDWGDLLTAYNGVPITHDGIGNPLNDGTWTYTWQHGRQLASMSRIDQSEAWQFTYNADGMRTQRTNGTTTYNYTYLGGQLTHMTVAGHTMYFAYDAAGTPLSLTYDGVTYYYVTNLQGDVVAILDNTGVEVVRYSYDAWGNLLSTTGTMADTLGYYNPLCYRGYVYDEETGLYYLQSRYYNPEMGRFINADGFTSTGQGLLGNNMFAYCLNNPVNHYDPSGKSAVAEGLKYVFGILPFADGLLPIGDIIAAIGITGVLIYEKTQQKNRISNITSNITSDTIDWGAGGDNRKNHILKGTKGKHVNGWKRFGIDPDNNNAWGLILPILEEVVDKADYYTTTTLPSGAMYIQYVKTYIEQGVEVVVKIWVDTTGIIQQISDAIPFIID